MEVFVVNSLLELRQLRHLFRAFPDVLFRGGYVSVRVEVRRIDLVEHALHVDRILSDFAEDFNCEVPNQELISDVADLANSLLFLKRMADDATRDIQLFDERSFEILGQAALFVRKNGAFATGRFRDFLFSVTKEAVSCANTGQALVSQNIRSIHRWRTWSGRLATVVSDVDGMLGTLSQLALDDGVLPQVVQRPVISVEARNCILGYGL